MTPDPEYDSLNDEWRGRRRHMVAEQLRARGVGDERVCAAMEKVPRHLFVPEHARAEAYSDWAVRLAEGQTVSQPYIVGYMTAALALRPGARVLEIGTGSGYQAAVLAEIAGEVFTIEVRPHLADAARRLLAALGYGRIHVRTGNGAGGWDEAAPFDGIIVTAAAGEVPPRLVAQLAVGGRLVIPIGVGEQRLHTIERLADGVRDVPDFHVRFVPFVWPEERM
ncbi:MAG TPA: protein-L-isoaspartate O-methyltransferase [Planctomycetes bacterium]|nr:protein-L-isoaspartate O-methyltransferase [Planctomycetota bacterium]